jgi:hypothetical protein
LKIVNLLHIVFLIVVITACAYSQSRQGQTSSRAGKTGWQLFAPAGMGFSIEVPVKPNRNDDEYGDRDPKGYKLIRVYESSKSSVTGSVYQIIVLFPSRIMRQTEDTNALAGLEFTIGGDDAQPASQSSISVHGLKGKEFIYHFPRAERLGHRKGRIIDARTRIFVLIYAADSASGLESSEATHFFNSFKVSSVIPAKPRRTSAWADAALPQFTPGFSPVPKDGV